MVHSDCQIKKDKQNNSTRLSIKVDSTPRRVRVRFNGLIIADSKEVLLLHERGHLPVYYFPEEDIRKEVLFPTDKGSRCPLKGNASYWTVKVGNRSAENAVWSYQDPIPDSKDIKGYFSFDWNQMDAWFEEEEEIVVHPRDPYKRVDALSSSRHIKIVLEGKTVAESRRPVIVFETGVPVRYYLPEEDIVMAFLEPSNLETRCPYKGIASYWTVVINGRRFEDLVWSYPDPVLEIPKIKGLFSFYNERLEIYVDGELQKPSSSYYSALDYFNESEI